MNAFIQQTAAATVALAALLALATPAAAASAVSDLALGRKPDATVDLRTPEGTAALGGRWKTREARVVSVEGREPGPDLRASGVPNVTMDLVPRGDTPDFAAGPWRTIDAPGTEARRGTGRLSFVWYRIDLQVPERVGPFDPTGSTAVLEVVVDDYAEIWVDGRLPIVLGAVGGPIVAGFNAPNRIVLGRDLRPGQRFRIAIFGANGPLSAPPANFVWMRTATVDFYSAERARPGREVPVRIVRKDPALDAIVPRDARLEKLAEGFGFTEGPVWMPDGYLLFSDPNHNTIYRWSPDGDMSVYRAKSGYSGMDIGAYRQPGSNGLAVDAEGRLIVCEHGNRRVVRIERTGAVTVLADRYEGKRLNSPNDVVVKSDGAVYFTDPPFGLPAFHDDPRRESPYTGVYRAKDGVVTLLAHELTGPNGIAFSPDERFLYVANWDVARKIVMRYPVLPDGGLGAGESFFSMQDAPGEEALDGIEVDVRGNLFVSGPGGVWILASDGRHLGTIVAPELPANFAWGDADGRTLFLTAREGLYRIRLSTSGMGTRLAATR